MTAVCELFSLKQPCVNDCWRAVCFKCVNAEVITRCCVYRKFLQSLPDGGRKISDFAEKVRLAIGDRDAKQQQKQSVLLSAGTDLQSKYQQAFSLQNSAMSPQNRPGEGAAAAIVDFAQEMDTSHTPDPDSCGVTVGAEETPGAGGSSGPSVTGERDLVQAMEMITLSNDTSSTRESKDALNSNAERDNFFLRKQPPMKPHYLEVLENSERISVHRRQKFKPNQ